jgi:hypothetical protein
MGKAADDDARRRFDAAAEMAVGRGWTEVDINLFLGSMNSSADSMTG